MHFVSSGIQDQILLLLDFFFHLRIFNEVRKWQQPVPDQFGNSAEIFLEMYFFWITDWKAISEQSNFFLEKKSVLRVLPMTSKAASGSLGQIVLFWIKRKVHRVEKIRTDTNNKGFT